MLILVVFEILSFENELLEIYFNYNVKKCNVKEILYNFYIVKLM